MAFQRATWHSGFTYKQVCRSCRTEVTYDDYSLDFRPWYPDGFVYCPKCQTPLRHNENYAINAPFTAQGSYEDKTNATVESSSNVVQPLFCSQCGKKFAEIDKFCSGCGAKR